MLDQTISHYRITQKLGAGGMGVVYKATDLTLERTVALKFLPSEVALSETEKENLLREARAASALDHPNIGVIHGLEESDDHQLFIVMAYYEGETLSQKLNRGMVSVRDSLSYAIQIARGLGAAHSRNIVHRDVKPSNILITKDNVAKIVDFGLARVVATASATQSVCNTGTLPYMAPEQILGEAVDQRADVWALGVLIVQMLTGSHPFLRPNTAAMTFAILNQPPSAVDAVPAPVQPIVYRALSKQVSHRYASTEEMVQDLDAARAQITSTPAAQDEPTVTRTVSPKDVRRYIENASTPRWSRESRRWRPVLLTAAILFAALAVLSMPRVRASLFGSALAGTEKHIAVLPFESNANDADSQLIANGLVDAMTSQLSNLEAAQQSLWVVPASVVRMRHINDPASAYRNLGAAIVVQGRLERRGQIVFLTINLIDAKRLRQIGSEQVEDRSGDLAALQNDVVFKLAHLLKATLPASELAPADSVNSSSYESYLKALGYLQRYDKPGNLDRAISTLDSALQKDARFALGYATLGEAYRLKAQAEDRATWLTQAAANGQKALAINDRLPSAHVTLGSVNLSLGKTDLALQEYQKALDLAPRDAAAVMGMAAAYEAMNRPVEAEASYRRSIALRPDYWDGYTALAEFYDRQKRVQDSIAQYKRVLDLTPDNSEGYSNLGAEYLSLNEPESNRAAEAAFRKSIELAPNYEAYANLAVLYLYENRYAESAEYGRKALELNDRNWHVWVNLLIAYEWLKDDTKAGPARAKTIALLEESAAANSQQPQVQSSLAIFYAQDKLGEKALSKINTALALAPKDAFILADVAEAYDVLGDRKSAVKYLRESRSNGFTPVDFQRRPGLQGVVTDPGFRSNGKL